MYFRGGGIKIANNLAVTEEGFVLDARQGKVLDEKIVKTKDDLSEMIQGSGRLDGNVDWNNYTTVGVYKVQNATMTAEYHAPVGLFKYGILVVLVSETTGEKRTKQIYYPNYSQSENSRIVMAIRTYNHTLDAAHSDAD